MVIAPAAKMQSLPHAAVSTVRFAQYLSAVAAVATATTATATVLVTIIARLMGALNRCLLLGALGWLAYDRRGRPRVTIGGD